MQIFVRKPQGNTTTLNVEKNETICTIKRKLKKKEGIRSDLHLGLIYNGKFLEDECTVSQCNIFKQSTLHLFLSQHTLSETWTLYIQTRSEKSFTVKVMSVDTIDDVKAKIQEKEGIPQHNQLLFRKDKWLEDGSLTLKEYGLFNWANLHLAIQFQEAPLPNVMTRGKPLSLSTPPAPQVAPRHAKRPRPATQTTPTKVVSNSHSILDTSDGEATAAPGDLKPEVRAHPPSSVLTELEDLKLEMATARSKEKELEATITELTQKNKELSSRCASYEIQAVALEIEITKTKEELTVACSKKKKLEASYESQMVYLNDENKKTKEVLRLAHNKGKDLEATITELTQKNKELSSQCASYEIQAVALEAENKKIKEEYTLACRKKKELEASYESQMVCLKDENKETKEELMLACNKGKELESSISGLTHKNRVFSDQCASYESQVIALEIENKKTKEELMNADKKYYSGARAAGYAEGLKEGKAKWLKSVEFLHHLTNASMQYFNYGFDSCEKQAEQQGFVGQLNKDSALKEAPKLKGWESSDQPY